MSLLKSNTCLLILAIQHVSWFRLSVCAAVLGVAPVVGLSLSAAVPPVTFRPPTEGLSSLIDGLQRKYSRMRGLSANFVQIYYGPSGRVLRESGTLVLKKPGKARWEYTSPERKLFVSDGRSIYFHVEGERQATRAAVKESVDPQIPFLFLLGKGDLRRDFKRIELISEERVVEAGNRLLRLVPRRAPAEFRRLLVEVHPSTFQVRRLVIFERNGGRMDFQLSNVRENHVVSDAEFRFSPPPGVTIRRAQ